MKQARIIKYLESQGYKAAFTHISRMHDLQEEFEDLISSGKVNSNVLQTIIRFDFDYSNLNHPVESVLVVSIRLPLITNDFTYQGKVATLVTPPGYIPGTETRQFSQDIKQVFAETNTNYTRALLPVKLLSNHMGLTQYGRNNISYVKEFGSFHMLAAYYTDVPVSLEESQWFDVERMSLCETCTNCVAQCPTSCIAIDKQVIDIGRCITRIYETEGEFPDWIKDDHHNCLMACLKCQDHCPANMKHLSNIDKRASFDEEETMMLLNKTPFVNLNETTRNKLSEMGIDRYYDIFLRNLGVQPHFR